jgi:hypothetical protein
MVQSSFSPQPSPVGQGQQAGLVIAGQKINPIDQLLIVGQGQQQLRPRQQLGRGIARCQPPQWSGA